MADDVDNPQADVVPYGWHHRARYNVAHHFLGHFSLMRPQFRERIKLKGPRRRR